jgi:glycosyltransferase involved in cell wall biosynthesis
LRVLYISRDYTPHDHRFLGAVAGSPQHQAFWLRLEKRGRRLEERPLPAGVTSVAWAGGQTPAGLADTPRLAADLRRAVAAVRPDVIHAGTVQTGALLAALAGVGPLVTMSWGSDLLMDADRNRWWQWATGYTLDHSTVLFADCRTVLRKAESFGFPAERAVLFPWGVDLATFRPLRRGERPGNDLRRRLDWLDKFVILSNRTWEPLYGVDVVVRAFAQAAQANPKLRLLLLGGGSQAGALRQILLENNLLERVYFGGQVANHDLPDYYRAADLYVSATHSDGSSVSLMEALASGCPVAVSDIPSNQEWVTPGEQGWLFRDGCDAELGERMLDAARLGDRLESLSLAARRTAEARADWRKNTAIMLAGYQKAVELSQQGVR